MTDCLGEGRQNVLAIDVDDKVEILEEQSNYTLFDLVIDSGSSLGLWIGLSILGVFDLVMQYCLVIKNCIKNRKSDK